jgi:lysophospholipase L1-like esterase
MKSLTLLCAIGILLMPSFAHGQLADEYKPPRGNCCLATAAQNLANQLQDWDQLGRYHDANQELMKQPAAPGRVVFLGLGDSITDGWRLDQFFPNKPYVNRGISGQTTPQMLVRMFPDVIGLQPAAMIVLAGTNDIARNTGPATLRMIQDNIQAMTELAQLHGIKVVLCSVTPIADYGRAAQTPQRPPADILKMNSWLKAHAAKTGAIYGLLFCACGCKRISQRGYIHGRTSPERHGIRIDGAHRRGCDRESARKIISRRTCGSDHCNRILQCADTGDCDSHGIAGFERKRIVRHDAGSGQQHGSCLISVQIGRLDPLLAPVLRCGWFRVERRSHAA